MKKRARYTNFNFLLLLSKQTDLWNVMCQGEELSQRSVGKASSKQTATVFILWFAAR